MPLLSEMEMRPPVPLAVTESADERLAMNERNRGECRHGFGFRTNAAGAGTNGSKIPGREERVAIHAFIIYKVALDQ